MTSRLALFLALAVFAAACADSSDTGLPDGISAPQLVEASAEPVPAYVEIDGRAENMPEPFREPVVATAAIAGLPLAGFGGFEFRDASELGFDSPDAGLEDIVGPIRYAFGQSASIDASDRAPIFAEASAYYDWPQVIWPSPGGEEPASLSNADRVVAVEAIAGYFTQLNHERYVNRVMGQEVVIVDAEVFRSLATGTAAYFGDVYFEALPEAAQQNVRDDLAAAAAEDEQAGLFDSQAGAEVVARSELGVRFFRAVAESRPDLERPSEVVSEVLEELPVLSSASFLDPWSHIGEGIERVSVPRNTGSGATGLDQVENDAAMNALDWYLILAPVVGESDALDAARNVISWSLIGEVEPENDDQACFDVRVSGESLAETFGAWAEADPENRSVADVGDGVLVSACTPLPGSAELPQGNPSSSLRYVSMVIDAETETVRQGVDRSVARCAVDLFLQAQGNDVIGHGDHVLYESVLDQLVTRCAE